jgi:membrane associated rhomboid family serine protease
MKTLLKNLGVLVLLAGIGCLAYYYFSKPENYLLVVGLVLEVVGILTYVIVNRFVD